MIVMVAGVGVRSCALGEVVKFSVGILMVVYIDGVGITYEDNRERVDYISMHHFRARS